MVNSNVIHEVEDEAYWVTYIKNRIEDNQNFIAICTGATGSGKTYTALSIAEQIDPNFDVEKQCVFKFKQVLELIKSKWFVEELKWKIIVWDEPQIEMSNRSWMSKMNKFINYLLTTFRHRNVILLFASPYKSFLDSQSMKLVHSEIKCMGWSDQTKLSKVKPRLLQYNDDKQKIYPHKLYIQTKQYGFNALDTWEVKKISSKMSSEYERIKTTFTTKLYTQMDKDMHGGNKEEGVIKFTKDYAQELQSFEELAELHNGNLYLIQKSMPNVSIVTLERLRRVYAQKKLLNSGKETSPYVNS